MEGIVKYNGNSAEMLFGRKREADTCKKRQPCRKEGVNF